MNNTFQTGHRIRMMPLYVKAKEAILQYIRQGRFDKNKLPPEKELSAIIGVSRTTVREALIALEREAIVTKRQGIGNLFHKSTLAARMRIDQIQNFSSLLSDGGYKVDFRRLSFGYTDSMDDMDADPRKSTYLFNEALYLADNKPAIVALLYVPASILIAEAGEHSGTYPSIKDFLHAHVSEDLSHAISVFKPETIGERVAQHLGVKPDVSIIKWEERYFGIYDNELCFSKVYFHPKMVNFTMLRKW